MQRANEVAAAKFGISTSLIERTIDTRKNISLLGNTLLLSGFGSIRELNTCTDCTHTSVNLYLSLWKYFLRSISKLEIL